MIAANRQCLKKGQTLLLCDKDNRDNKRTFTIVGKLSEGASSVCYEAYHDNAVRGVIKEFYPRGAFDQKRDNDHQLILHSSEFTKDAGDFKRAREQYLKPYGRLVELVRNTENPDLASFIPSIEIYRSCAADDAAGTAYIWTPQYKLETFEQICDDIHKHPRKNPEYKLVTALHAIESLAQCVCALHMEGLLHRDIKPSNFGFTYRENKALTETFSLFDLDSVCALEDRTGGAVGTNGYMEPEAGYQYANNQTDIYSIGATLFHAIVVSDETKANNYLYRKEYYARLEQMVDASKLIQASEANSHPRLRYLLADILKKCLARRGERYERCEDLLEDLRKALFYALPPELAKMSRAGEKWCLMDAEKSLDRHKEKNSFLSIQYHLYEHPLYQCCSDGDDLNVLAIGFGNYGQKFLDACLQDGQMLGKNLHITVVSDDDQDKQSYLRERPELEKFFNIDGALDNDKDTYGKVTFKKQKLERNDQKKNIECLKGIIKQHTDKDRPYYVFIALGEDALNRSAADACKETINNSKKDVKNKFVISYICENEETADKGSEGLYPVYVNRDIKKSPLHAEIERMAFNTHLVWEKNLNVDYGAVRAEFRKPYNHDSCVSNVLSLKYKLFSIGIDLDQIGSQEAARRFIDALRSGRKSGLKNKLIWIEHRRWVTEKLCLGWRRIDNLKDCAGGVTKDERNKRHVCIVKSRPDQMLTTGYRAAGYAKWDCATEQEIKLLDELDQTSVALHRMYKENADAAKNQNPLAGHTIAHIKSLIADNGEAVVAFQEWFSCMKDIWNDDLGKTRLYKSLKASFLRAVDSLPPESRESVREDVKSFEALFYPILASKEYRDWKQDDVALIDRIPFILTYTENAYMVIPYTAGDNPNALFRNVAAPTVVNPARILYLYMIDNSRDLKALKTSIPYVMAYMRKKNLKATVEFILVYDEDAVAASLVRNTTEKDLSKDIIELGAKRIRRVKLLNLAGIAEYLNKRRSGKPFFAVEKNRAGHILQGAGLYNLFANYSMDYANGKFSAMKDCDMLGYIRTTPYITVADMLALRNSSSKSSNQPEFFEDYQALWKTYRANPARWKAVCNLLGQYAAEKDILASFNQKFLGRSKSTPDLYRYILPAACRKSAEKIVSFLIEQKIIGNESCVNAYTTDSCKVEIADYYQHPNRGGNNNSNPNNKTFKKLEYTKYDELFSNVYALLQPDAITTYPVKTPDGSEAKVKFDDLTVAGAQLTGAPSYIKSDIDLLKGLQDSGYIINLTLDPNDRVSFTYATRRSKELLTTAGKILEVYTYHAVKALGEFDDVVSSYEIDWEGTKVKNEFDCILTKGFMTLFVECKATVSIDQDYYHKLSQLVEQFGINATRVLIADTGDEERRATKQDNSMERERGSMMDVITVCKEDEIDDIGQTLLKIAQGNYTQQIK